MQFIDTYRQRLGDGLQRLHSMNRRYFHAIQPIATVNRKNWPIFKFNPTRTAPMLIPELILYTFPISQH